MCIKYVDTDTTVLSKRQSNIELLRIVGLFAILCHHYVVNSGIMQNIDPVANRGGYCFLSYWGMWGKTGINIFILISGYFMCKSELTIKRYCKVAFEIYFYNFIIYFALLVSGYESIGLKRIYKLFFSPLIYANGSGNFTSSFLIFYLFIPYMNLFIKRLSKKQFRSWILFLLFIFTGLSTLFFNNVIFGEVFWFGAVYFIGGYLRLYPPKWSEELISSLRLLILSLVLAWLSVAAIIVLNEKTGTRVNTSWFVADANKLGAVLVGVFAFTTFKNLKIGYSRLINFVAKTTFGILLIHANSDAMRQWLWRDFLHVDTSYSLPVGILILRSVLITVIIFIVCSLIDMIRICAVEKPVFMHFSVFEKMILRIWETIKNVLFEAYKRVFYRQL